MDAPRAPRLALSAIGVIALVVCGELVARIQGDRLCAETPGAFLQADPRFGWTHVPGLSGWARPCTTAGVPAVAVDATADGRLDLERPLEKAPGTARILLLGGTLAEPLGVRHPLGVRPTTLARLLEARADRRRGAPLEVIDASTRGWSLDNDLAYLRDEGLRHAPDVVLVVVDPTRDIAALSPALVHAAGEPVPVKPWLALDGDRVIPAAPVGPDAKGAADTGNPAGIRVGTTVPPTTGATAGAPPPGRLGHSQLLRWLTGTPRRVGPPVAVRTDVPPPADAGELRDERERARRLAGAALRALRDASAAGGAKLALAVGSPGTDPAAREDAVGIRDAALALGIPTVDLAPAFSGFEALTGAPTTWPGDGDWNADGHFVASDALWRLLRDDHLLPASVVEARALDAGQVRDPSTFPAAIVDSFRRDRHTLFLRFLQLAALAACVVWIASPLPPALRDWVLVALGLGLAALLGTPSIAIAFLAFAVAFHAAAEIRPGPPRTAAVGGLLALLVLAPVLWLPGLLPGYEADAREYASFATNVALLRFWSHARDRGRELAAGAIVRPRREFLAAMLFFPTFVNGPIQSLEQLAAARAPGGIAPESFADLHRHLRRSAFAVARAAAAVVAAYAAFALLNDKLRFDVFATGGEAVSRLRLWAWVGELYFLFYFGFAAWSTCAISLGRICGADVPENFHRPWAARNVADFWRRWHVSFGDWLRETIYRPLGGRRHAAANVGLVFLVSALWHVWGAVKLIGPTGFPPRAWSGLLLWGALGAIGVLWAQRFAGRAHASPRPPSPGRRLAARGATFVYTALAWVPFFMPPTAGLGDCLKVFARLFFLR